MVGQVLHSDVALSVRGLRKSFGAKRVLDGVDLDLRRGEVVVAAVVLKEGQEADEAGLRAHVKAQLAAFKVPRAIWFPSSLPKGGTNKIVKREIEIPAYIRER